MPAPLPPLAPNPYYLPREPFRPHFEPGSPNYSTACDQCHAQDLMRAMWVCPLPGDKTAEILCNVCKTARYDTPAVPTSGTATASQNGRVASLPWQRRCIIAILTLAACGIAYHAHGRGDAADVFVIGCFLLAQQVYLSDPALFGGTKEDG